jgi:hypothetical protein
MNNFYCKNVDFEKENNHKLDKILLDPILLE